MKAAHYTIQDLLGIHARPAGQLVKVAANYSSDIRISTTEKSVDAKRIMGVMSLGAKKGDVITVSCSGADEQQALSAVLDFLKKNV